MEKIKKQITLQYDNTLNFFVNIFGQSSTKEGFIRYFKNTGWLFAGRLSGMIASFFVGAYVARYLGPSQYGLLSYAASFAGLFSVFSSLGIDSILNRELVKTPEKRDILLGSGFVLKIIGSIISISFIIISLLIIKTNWITTLLILINGVIFFFNAFLIIDNYFQSNVLADKTVKAKILTIIIISVLKLIFIYYQLSLIWFVITGLIDVIIFSIGLGFSYRKMGLFLSKWKFNRDTAKMLLINSWPMMFSGIAIAIYMKIDQVMITNMIGIEANGLYSVAVKISEVWYFIPALICASLFPAIINAKKTDPIIYEKRMRKLYSLMFYFPILIAIPITILSNFIIINLFGVNYTGAIDVLRVHIWSGVGVFLGVAVTQYLIVENFTKIFFATTIIGAILNIVFNIILIPKMGIMGSAIATLISYTIQTLSVSLFKETRKQILLMFKSLNIF